MGVLESNKWAVYRLFLDHLNAVVYFRMSMFTNGGDVVTVDVTILKVWTVTTLLCVFTKVDLFGLNLSLLFNFSSVLYTDRDEMERYIYSYPIA